MIPQLELHVTEPSFGSGTQANQSCARIICKIDSALVRARKTRTAAKGRVSSAGVLAFDSQLGKYLVKRDEALHALSDFFFGRRNLSAGPQMMSRCSFRCACKSVLNSRSLAFSAFSVSISFRNNSSWS